MTSDIPAIGVDARDSRYFVARVEHQTGRPEVKALARFDGANLLGHPLLENGRLNISAPDDKILVRELRLSSATDQESRSMARFEMQQSMIDDEREFCFDSLPVGAGDRHEPTRVE